MFYDRTVDIVSMRCFMCCLDWSQNIHTMFLYVVWIVHRIYMRCFMILFGLFAWFTWDITWYFFYYSYIVYFYRTIFVPLTTRKRALDTGWEGPKAPVSQPVPRNRDHWTRLKAPGFSTGALGFYWYRLEITAGTKEAATLT